MAANNERAFVAIKPDGIQLGLVGDIMTRLEKRRYKLVALKMITASKNHLEVHYQDLKNKPFFPSLISYTGSGPVAAMVWEGLNAVKHGRVMLGATNLSPHNQGLFVETTASRLAFATDPIQTVCQAARTAHRPCPTPTRASGGRLVAGGARSAHEDQILVVVHTSHRLRLCSVPRGQFLRAGRPPRLSDERGLPPHEQVLATVILSKKFVVNGCDLICVDEKNFDNVRKMFKENVTLDDLENRESKEELEKYDASTFITKARHYLSLSPPDLVQSAEKLWFAAVYAVKELYLTSGGVDLKSHNSLKFFVRFAIKHAELSDDIFWHLHDSWTKAEKMHRDVYGSSNFRASEYAQIICDVETFVDKFEAVDRKSLWVEFEKAFISGNNPDVVISKESHSIILGGSLFKCDYSVFV